jgi:hypothetical protein
MLSERFKYKLAKHPNTLRSTGEGLAKFEHRTVRGNGGRLPNRERHKIPRILEFSLSGGGQEMGVDDSWGQQRWRLPVFSSSSCCFRSATFFITTLYEVRPTWYARE